MQDYIIVRGAKEHNLKNINVVIPRDKITVITGPSGSGKSSLAMDVIYAEGQRRYVESLSNYARQFLEQFQKPEVESIEGLSPTIAIDQKTVIRSPRSTVGTITEIYDYMRVLFTRIGVPYCYQCGTIISVQDVHNIIKSILSLPQGTRIQILAPIVRGRKGEYKKELSQMKNAGFVRARIDGKMCDLTQNIELKKQKKHTIEVVIDRLLVKPSIERYLRSAIDTSLKYADTVVLNLVDEGKDILFSRTLACSKCGISYPDIEPRLFSFNSKYGACPCCDGLGYENVKDEDFSINNFSKVASYQEIFQGLSPCKCCNGMRLRKEALNIKINGINIGQFNAMTVKKAKDFIEKLHFSEREKIISKRILKEVKDRLNFLDMVGLSYITLDRGSYTLSGGESQRIRLANQIGSSLTGVLYILDEPTIGLHPRDCYKMLESLSAIRDAGNTVIIVEHNEEVIKWADHLIDMGPGAGVEGGWIVADGNLQEIKLNNRSLTGKYLSCERRIDIPQKRRIPQDFLKIVGASEFNLKNIDVAIPLGIFCCITGVSGSGKSTLIFEILYKALAKHLNSSSIIPGKHKCIEGIEKIDKVICIDQSPIGKTSRSNPATYTGLFNYIRRLFSLSPEARAKGYTQSRFSFNIKGGRCETCQGAGVKRIEMHFLPEIHVTCDSCNGKRYNRETLDIRYKGRNISDVLEMTITEAFEFFKSIPVLRQRLEILLEMGMGYLKLGQPATTLSGGEAQRLKLSTELGKKATGKTLYILDEPTSGLHFIDIERLIKVLNKLVDAGNSVIVIEHDLDIIKSADYIIDLGPGAGEDGGKVVAFGTPEEVAESRDSYTGRYLSMKLYDYN
ncbi:MAG: excinuclease ABC subunit UvrA [Thermodesulfovibrionales bacterium]|nr:excinuclease ABC subunit UvrA [Thermodesulfovibrionales bacterium]